MNDGVDSGRHHFRLNRRSSAPLSQLSAYRLIPGSVPAILRRTTDAMGEEKKERFKKFLHAGPNKMRELLCRAFGAFAVYLIDRYEGRESGDA